MLQGKHACDRPGVRQPTHAISATIQEYVFIFSGRNLCTPNRRAAIKIYHNLKNEIWDLADEKMEGGEKTRQILDLKTALKTSDCKKRINNSAKKNSEWIDKINISYTYRLTLLIGRKWEQERETCSSLVDEYLNLTCSDPCMPTATRFHFNVIMLRKKTAQMDFIWSVSCFSGHWSQILVGCFGSKFGPITLRENNSNGKFGLIWWNHLFWIRKTEN